MLIVGINLNTLCKAVKIPIAMVGAYRYKDGEAVFLYDTRGIVHLLNIPETVFKTYNAWLSLPGEWSGYSSGHMAVHIGRNTLTVPAPIGKDLVAIQKTYYNDIFEFVRKVFKAPEIADSLRLRVFDLLYTTARLNRYDGDLKRLLDATADKW